MKYLLFFLLIGCSHAYQPKYAVGDCIGHTREERWISKSDERDAKIVAIGNTHYHMIYFNGYEVDLAFCDFSFIDDDKVRQKISCDGYLNEKHYE